MTKGSHKGMFPRVDYGHETDIGNGGKSLYYESFREWFGCVNGVCAQCER